MAGGTGSSPPPRYFQFAATHKVDPGQVMPRDPGVRQEAINGGILNGGPARRRRAVRHALLQWRCVKVVGGVTVIDNVMTISVQDRRAMMKRILRFFQRPARSRIV